MHTLAFGLFRDRAAADAAVARLERQEHGAVTIHEHSDELSNQDIQGPGTRSWLYAVLGGLFAAVLGGVLAAIFFGHRVWIGPLATGIVAGIAAGAFGTLAGIAGAALPRRELERLEHEVAEGKALVTIDAESKRSSEGLQKELERCGATRTGVLYGPGLGSTRIARRHIRRKC
jgi:hypothetical protein